MILPYTETNKAGQKITYWTHSSFINKNKINHIFESQQSRETYRNYLGLLGGVLGLKLSTVPAICKLVPKNIPGYGVAAISGAVFYGLGHLLFVSGALDRDINRALQQESIPLWKQKSRVLNLDRAFFHLDESKNNSPSLLHYGLTAENAAKVFPDAVRGPAPKAPQAHHGHHDDHHGKH